MRKCSLNAVNEVFAEIAKAAKLYLPVDNADTFQQWLLEEFEDNGETVMFAPGAPMYATPGKGLNEVRMAYVLECDKLERAMDLLALGIKKYNETH